MLNANAQTDDKVYGLKLVQEERHVVAKDITPRLYEKLAQKNDQLFWGGVALAVVGVLALIFPVQRVRRCSDGGVAPRFGRSSDRLRRVHRGRHGLVFRELLIGLLKLALGVYLLRHPDVSIVALTLLLVAVFMVDGAVQVALAFELRPIDGWVWVLLAGLVSIGVALLIAAEFPPSLSLRLVCTSASASCAPA